MLDTMRCCKNKRVCGPKTDPVQKDLHVGLYRKIWAIHSMSMLIIHDLMLDGSLRRTYRINQHGSFFQSGALQLSYLMILGFHGMVPNVLTAVPYRICPMIITFIHFSRLSQRRCSTQLREWTSARRFCPMVRSNLPPWKWTIKWHCDGFLLLMVINC